MRDTEYADADRRCKQILGEVARRKQECLDTLVRVHGVAKIELNIGRLVTYNWEHEVRLVLGNGKVVFVRESCGKVEVHLDEFDPKLKELEEEFRKLNNKFHMYPS